MSAGDSGRRRTQNGQTVRRAEDAGTDIEVRLATAADEIAVLNLIEELFDPPGSRPPNYSRDRSSTGFRAAVEGADADILLAVRDDHAIGLASVYADIQSIRYGKRCWLQDLIVSQEQRSTGVGAALLAEASDWARAHGCTHLELASGAGRKDAHRFYLREGMSQSYNFQLWLG